MKKILLPVRPKYCKLIFNCEKTIEVRKTAPKLETPFEVLVYQTKIKFKVRNWQENFQSMVFTPNGGAEDGNGKVIGSFVCDYVAPIAYSMDGIADFIDCKSSCLSPTDFINYGKGKPLYGWHITEPKLFDKPKDITEFALYGKCAEDCDEYDFCARDSEDGRMSCKYFKRTFLKRPPQSYCFVETDER